MPTTFQKIGNINGFDISKIREELEEEALSTDYIKIVDAQEMNVELSEIGKVIFGQYARDWEEEQGVPEESRVKTADEFMERYGLTYGSLAFRKCEPLLNMFDELQAEQNRTGRRWLESAFTSGRPVKETIKPSKIAYKINYMERRLDDGSRIYDEEIETRDKENLKELSRLTEEEKVIKKLSDLESKEKIATVVLTAEENPEHVLPLRDEAIKQFMDLRGINSMDEFMQLYPDGLNDMGLRTDNIIVEMAKSPNKDKYFKKDVTVLEYDANALKPSQIWYDSNNKENLVVEQVNEVTKALEPAKILANLLKLPALERMVDRVQRAGTAILNIKDKIIEKTKDLYKDGVNFLKESYKLDITKQNEEEIVNALALDAEIDRNSFNDKKFSRTVLMISKGTPDFTDDFVKATEEILKKEGVNKSFDNWIKDMGGVDTTRARVALGEKIQQMGLSKEDVNDKVLYNCQGDYEDLAKQNLFPSKVIVSTTRNKDGELERTERLIGSFTPVDLNKEKHIKHHREYNKDNNHTKDTQDR